VLTVHRLQFAFTIVYHYIFPQLTMGLAFLIVVLKTMSIRTGRPHYDHSALFWARIFGLNFALGVVTGIPMEFQFGTNWARFSAATGGIIGQTLALEGVYSFFLESSFLGLFLYAGNKLGRVGHWASAVGVWLGSWLSGYFITATNAWMQHPVGHHVNEKGEFVLDSLGAMLSNPWLLWQYPHTILGSLMTASGVMAGVGAFYLLQGRDEIQARIFVRTGAISGLAAALLLGLTGDGQGKNVARYQPVTLAAMEALFETKKPAPLVLIGQPDMERLRLDNPIEIPAILSALTYHRWDAEVKGLDSFPRELWPDNVPLLYYSYHVMVGLGTIFMAVTAWAVWLLWRGRMFASKSALWLLLLMLPFPYIANTAGWMTAELGRQPWLVYGLLLTRDGSSANVSAGNTLFTLIGFLGLYLVLGILFLFLVWREIERGPEAEKH
jgi:cytochrome d ubiquinol oxidase subunit I